MNEIRVTGQERFVVRPDENGIPEKVKVPSSDVVVEEVGKGVVSATRRQALFGVDPMTEGKQADRENTEKRLPSRWDSLTSSPQTGRRLVG